MILRSEADATLEGPAFDVIITHDPDHAQGAATRAEWFHSRSTSVFTEPITERGRAAARNRARTAGRGKVIVFTTPSAVVPPGWEQALLRLFNESRAVVAGVDGSFAAVRRSWFDRVNGFDEQFVNSHEVDDLRAQAAAAHELTADLVMAGIVVHDPLYPPTDPDDDLRFRAKWGLR